MRELTDLRDDPWLAGFADGEGCFILNRQPNGYIAPQFGIGLRADDKAILVRIHETFGGSLHWQPAQPATGSSPQWRWRATGGKGLASLVEYFERFPLRSKKRADYELWRPAVRIWCAAGGWDPRLTELRDAMMAGRRYEAEAQAAPAIDGPQMELVA